MPTDSSSDGGHELSTQRVSFKYDAFISYSHKQDARLGKALQASLQSFARPFFRSRSMRIFIDDASLPMTSDLWGTIESALAQSSFLLLLACPASHRSKWVSDEVEAFVRIHGTERVGIALTKGKTPWTDPEFDDESPTCAISGKVIQLLTKAATEPLVIDLRPFRDENGGLSRTAEYDGCIAAIASAITGRDKDALYGEHLARLRRRVTIFAALLSALLLLTIAACTTAYLAFRQMRLAQSRELTALAELNLARDPVLALQQALEAATKAPTRSAERALWRATTVQNTTHILRHGAPVTDALFSDDGQILISSDEDGILHVWDLRSSLKHRTYESHQGAIYDLDLTTNGELVVTGGEDGTVRLWNLSKQLPPTVVVEHEGAVIQVDLSANGRYVASVGEDGTTRLHDARSDRPRSILARDEVQVAARKHAVIMRDVEFSPDTETLISVGDAEVARVWNVSTSTVKYTIPHSALHATFSGNGKQILTVSEDKGGAVWDAETGDLIYSTNANDSVYHGALSPDETELTTAGDLAQVWKIRDGAEPQTLQGHTNIIRQAVYSPDARFLATASEDTTARLWSRNSHKSIDLFLGHRGRVTGISFAPKNGNLATISDDGTARIWRVDMARGSLRLVTGFGRRGLLFPAPDKKALLLIDEQSGDATVWDLTQENVIAADLPKSCQGAVFSPEGDRVLLLCEKGRLSIWDSQTWTPLSELEGHSNDVRQATFSRNGTKIVTASADGSARIWDARSGQLINTLKHEGNSGEVVFTAFLGKGNRVVTVDTAGTIRVWDAGTGSILHSDMGGRFPYFGFATPSMSKHALSLNGARTTYPNQGDGLVVWDIASRMRVDTVDGGDWPVAISHDGRFVLAAVANAEDGTAHLRDTKTKMSRILRGHQASLRSAEFSPHGDRILTRSRDGTVIVWDVETGVEIYTYARPDGTIVDATFSPGGASVITIDDVGIVRVFPAGFSELRKLARRRQPIVIGSARDPD